MLGQNNVARISQGYRLLIDNGGILWPDFEDRLEGDSKRQKTLPAPSPTLQPPTPAAGGRKPQIWKDTVLKARS